MDIKKYKKEQENAHPHEKISNALAKSIHIIKAPMEMRAKLKGIKEQMSHKMKLENGEKSHIKSFERHTKKNPHDDKYDLDKERSERGYGKRANY